MRLRFHFIGWILLCLLPGFACFGQENDKRFDGFDTRVEELRTSWNAPGIGIAIVDRGKIIYSKGFGFRDVEKKLPVDENTLFPVGSCTKPFTSALLGRLMDEGKLDFDTPVTQYIPELKFSAAEMNSQVTARDMMSHRTGLPRHDLVWYSRNLERDSILYLIQHLETSAPIRSKWQYNNFTFTAQGALAEKISNRKWEDLMKGTFLKPLKMYRSNLSYQDFIKTDNISIGYRTRGTKVNVMPYKDLKGIAPAGSLNSTPIEMANWLMAWTNAGIFNEQQVIPRDYLNQAITPQIVKSNYVSFGQEDEQFQSYGMGWHISSYRGRYLVYHDGNIDGFSSMTAFLPVDSIGIVVMVNQNVSELPVILRNEIIDRMTNLSRIDWSKVRSEKLRVLRESFVKANPSAPLNDSKTNVEVDYSDYSGDFHHPAYGTLTLFEDNKVLKGKLGILNLAVRMISKDEFSVSILNGSFDYPNLKMTCIRMKNKNKIASVSLGFPPDQSPNPIVFSRKVRQ